MSKIAFLKNKGIWKDYPCSRVEKALEIRKENVEKFRSILTKEEFYKFDKAFLLEKENLNKSQEQSHF